MGGNATLASAAAPGQPNVSCTCNCERSLFQSMEISECPRAPLPGHPARPDPARPLASTPCALAS